MSAWLRLFAALIIVVSVGTWITVAGPERLNGTSPHEQAAHVSQPELADRQEPTVAAKMQQSGLEERQVEQLASASSDEESGTSAALAAESQEATAEPKPLWRQDDYDALAALTVEPEGSGGIDYVRDDYDIYGGRDEDGCNTRDRVLLEEAVRLISVDDDCNIIGVWYSWLDGNTISDDGELEIDHLVSLSEAHDSGAWRWDLERRKAFNNDLEHPEALSAVSIVVNRSKWAYDPSEWRPPQRSAWCRFARDWISVKLTWQLTADADEVTALAEMLQTCAGPP